jgi:type I restriction enzyme M protein
LGSSKRKVDQNNLPDALLAIQEWEKGQKSSNPVVSFVTKVDIGKTGDYNLSGDRYQKGIDHSKSEWPIVSLGDVVDIYNGSTPKKSDADYWEKGTIPWFTIEDIRTQGRVIRSTRQFVTEKALQETSIKLLPKNSVLLCCTASLGEYAFSEIEVTTNQQFNGLVVKDIQKLLPKYLFWCVSNFKQELERMSGKATFGFVSMGNLKKFKIPLPPLEVQEKVVAEIDGYAAEINSAKALIKSYEDRTQAVIARLWDSTNIVINEKHSTDSGEA